MKKISMIVVLLFKLSYTYCQPHLTTDSIYYLLPENKDDSKSSIWKFELDEPVMFAKLQCPCLENGEMPILSYKLNDEKIYLDTSKAKAFTTISLAELIIKCKTAISQRNGKRYEFFLLEQVGNKYLVHHAKLSQTHSVN